MLFRQLYDATSSTYSYLLADAGSREAVLIDPVFERHQRDAALIRELGLRLVCTLDTHCHADHVTGAWLMKQALGSRIGLSAVYGGANVDLPLGHGQRVEFGAHALQVRATPGHTDGCLSFVTDDQSLEAARPSTTSNSACSPSCAPSWACCSTCLTRRASPQRSFDAPASW